MDNFSKTFIAIAFMILVVILSAIVGGSLASMGRSEAIKAMTDKGANPQAASCSIDGPSESNKVICTLLANQQK